MSKCHQMTSWNRLGAFHLWKLVVDLFPLMKVKYPDNVSILDGQVFVVFRHLHGFWAATEIDLKTGLKVPKVVHTESIGLVLSATLDRADLYSPRYGAQQLHTSLNHPHQGQYRLH